MSMKIVDTLNFYSTTIFQNLSIRRKNMTKKKIYKLAIFILFAIIPTVLLLSACGKKARKDYYFTVDALPLHVSEVRVQNTTGGGCGYDSKGNFLQDGDIAEIYIFIEQGYELGTLKVLSNGEVLPLNKESGNYYKTTFKPTKDFAITFAGAVAPKVAYISLAVKNMMRPENHDKIMVEIDRYDLFGLEKGTMNFTDFEQAVENIGSSLVQTNYDTPITVSVYTIGEYDFTMRLGNVIIFNNDSYGIGYNDQVEKIVDEENQKYGYKHTIRFSENNTITITDEVIEEYEVKFLNGWYDISMNKDLFTLSVNGETRAKITSNDCIQGVVKLSDFKGTELPKLKIDFLKYADENYKNFYDELTFDLAGKQAQRSADGSYIEIEFDKHYNYDLEDDRLTYNFGDDRYVVSTNALDLLKKMNIVTEKYYRIAEKIGINGIESDVYEDFSQYGRIVNLELNIDKLVGKHGTSVYFLKNEFLTLTINFYSEVDYEYIRFGDVVVRVNSTENSDVKVTKGLYDVDGETKASFFIITVRASVPTEKIEFFTNNP